MNKLNKIGLSALCGSLASIVGANAGPLDVTGAATMTYTTVTGTTGNPIGMGSNLTFKGSGELDNGWGVAISIAGTIPINVLSRAVTVRATIISLTFKGETNKLVKFLLQISSRNNILKLILERNRKS